MSLMSIINFLYEAVTDFLSKNCVSMAAAISFYALFSMFPLGLAVVSVTGFIIGPDSDRTKLAIDMAEVLPVSSDLIGSTMEGIVNARTITGIVSFLGLIWASSAAFGAIRRGINTAWGVTRPRPFLRERLIDIGLVFGAGILVIIILFTAPIISVVSDLVKYFDPDGDFQIDFVLELIARLISPVLAFISILILYAWMPNVKVRMQYVVPGALIATAGFIAGQWCFIWVVSTFSLYNAVYGSVGALLALQAWLYISAIILLFGAQLTSMFHKYGVGENEKSKLDKMMLAVKKRGNRIVGSIKF
ncbi:MAG: YihY/virulence factor BrkB family protein [Chloroflexota bacterium]|nr:YihY/virulence factor BrkB family protein [Chloroflexota bacterium]